MEDLAFLGKLKQEQARVLQENQKSQSIRQKILGKYKVLKEKLGTLPHQTSHLTRVPAGDVGFFSGKLIHTNEMLVLLGDNWFADRSAKEATEIVDRRIVLINQQVDELRKEYDNMKSHLEFTDHFQMIKEDATGIKEIKETLPEDYPTVVKGKQRRAHVPRHNLTPRSVKFRTSEELVDNIKRHFVKGDQEGTINHNELLARLNQLEKEEQFEEEKEHLEKIKYLSNGEYEPTEHANNCNNTIDHSMYVNKRHVQFENDNEINSLITFQHSEFVQQREISVSDLVDVNIRPKLVSPADIYEQFIQSKHENDDKPLKSILKKDSRSNSNENLKLRPILKTSPEHRPETPEYVIDDPKPILKTPPDTQGSDHRPGTPEYVFIDEPKPILKGNLDFNDVRPKTPDSFTDEPKHSILKTQEVHFSDHTNYVPDYNGEETKSILKASNDSPAHTSGTLEDDQKGGILKTEQHIRTILKSPETRLKDFTDLSVGNDCKLILRAHTGVEAFSGVIVERSTNEAWSNNSSKQTSSCKPLSKFKASRLKQ